METINKNNLLFRIDEKMQDIEKSEHRAIRSDEVLRCIVTQHVEDAVPVVHAHWENIGGGHAECSNCGMTVSADYPASPSVHYCAKCGAIMDGKEEK